MKRKRQINGRYVIDDLRSGLTDRELQIKYCLSANSLCRIFEKLVDRGTMSHSELSERSPLYSLRTSYKESRTYPRADLAVNVPIYDLSTGSAGILRDISERGFRVAGIDARVGRTSTFQVPVDTFLRADPLLMVAECKWAKTRRKIKEYVVAGFEIIDLSMQDSNTLQDFMSVLLLSESGHWKTLSSTGNSHDQKRCDQSIL
ncbi:MAG: PilZ domain-containing protein [Bacteroidetes bacterium]|nr:PilZ domain-containing protein [Bacteroidota bacterium]